MKKRHIKTDKTTACVSVKLTQAVLFVCIKISINFITKEKLSNMVKRIIEDGDIRKDGAQDGPVNLG